MTDLTKLKELAELASKATPGPWWIDSHGHCMVSESQDHRTVFLTNDGMGPATRHPETGNLSHWPNDWDASYIASADPTTILELIAEVERLRTRLEIDERTPYDGIACRDETIKGLDEKCDRLKRQVDMLINQHMPREPIPDMPGWTRVIDADRLKAENEALRQFAAEAYQVLGAIDAPENVLDNASDAASGVPPRHETLLPFFAEGYEALRKDSERYRELRKITPHRFKKLQEAATTDGGDVFYFHADRFDAALDAALEGGGNG